LVLLLLQLVLYQLIRLVVSLVQPFLSDPVGDRACVFPRRVVVLVLELVGSCVRHIGGVGLVYEGLGSIYGSSVQYHSLSLFSDERLLGMSMLLLRVLQGALVSVSAIHGFLTHSIYREIEKWMVPILFGDLQFHCSLC